MKKQVAAAAMGAALLAGGGIGAALMTPTFASAESNGAAATAAAGSDRSTDATPAKPGAWVEDVLAGLVEDGTLTQAQADKVQVALEEARPQGGPGGPGGRGGPGRGGPGLEAAASALGIEASELRTALESGQTIAEVASARSVDVQTVIDAIVAEMQSHLDEAVSDGRLTQEQAGEMEADATERASALVNGERPARGDGPPPGFGGPPSSGSSSSDSSDASTSSSAS